MYGLSMFETLLEKLSKYHHLADMQFRPQKKPNCMKHKIGWEGGREK